jgi:hypothetical protein
MRNILLVALVAVLALGVLAPASLAQTRNVTFVVNSATVPDTVFPGYTMQIRGSHAPLTWGNDTGGQLVNIGGDYWSVTLPFTVGDTVFFKIFAGSDGWESNLTNPYGFGGNDRAYIIANNDTVLPVQFFNSGTHGRPQYFRPWTDVPDTFMNVYVRVNMQGADQSARFGYNDLLEGDSVGVRGGGPDGGDLNWSPTFYLTKETAAVNGGFGYPARFFKSGRLRIPKSGVTEGQMIDYKYLIGFDWGRDELQGQANRQFRVPTGKKDTTIYFSHFDNIRPSARVNADTVIATFRANMQRAITTGGFSIGDTIVVRTGYFGTAAQSGREKRLIRQGLSTFYAVTDTIVTAINFTLDYQYYLIKLGQEVRENYYNFYYTGEIQAEAERRQMIVPGSTFTVQDTATSITQAHRQPVFPNTRTLTQNVMVRWEVDLRPAIYQVMAGDTLNDIQGSFHVTPADVDSILPWGVWMNGPAVGGWSNPGGNDWGVGLQQNLNKKLWDDGTNGDQVAGDSVFTRMVLASPDSLGIGTKGQVGQVFKFGIRGGDNEGGRGGFGNNHLENLDDTGPTYTLRSQFGSINPAFYNAWNFDCGCPATTSVREIPGIPQMFELTQNYPNPFNPATRIEYTIPGEGFVTLKVYNMLGQEVATLVNEKQKAARYEVSFDGKALASGVYFYKLIVGNFVSTKKMMLLK